MFSHTNSEGTVLLSALLPVSPITTLLVYKKPSQRTVMTDIDDRYADVTWLRALYCLPLHCVCNTWSDGQTDLGREEKHGGCERKRIQLFRTVFRRICKAFAERDRSLLRVSVRAQQFGSHWSDLIDHKTYKCVFRKYLLRYKVFRDQKSFGNAVLNNSITANVWQQ